ncbi:MAG TPA: hypothetical protein VHM90_03895 [Phycisphaerae bacterium]|jgi:hypothetical protein|nr:hypothetical protein [Phycisphaerae bacterium]
MANGYVEIEYPKSHMMKIMGLDMIIFLIGLLLAASPFATRAFPGDIDTTSHVALGALIAVLAIFRVLVAYGSIWIDIVLIAFGVITLSMPRIMHMMYDGTYNTAHLVLGAVIIVFSLISMFLTLPVMKQVRH